LNLELVMAMHVDIRLCHKRKHSAVLIELKSSLKQADLKKDAKKALKQIEAKNYRNTAGLRHMRTLREYGIASFHLSSYVIG
jgi:hypothetical protein